MKQMQLQQLKHLLQQSKEFCNDFELEEVFRFESLHEVQKVRTFAGEMDSKKGS